MANAVVERARSRARYYADPAAEAARLAAIQEETAALAEHHGEAWSAEDVAVLFRSGVTARQAALALGRTYSSVTSARRRYRRQAENQVKAA